MATQQHPSEDHTDRCSCIPHEASPRVSRPLPAPRGLALLGLLTLVLGATGLRVAWHGDQGEGEGAVPASNTEPTAAPARNQLNAKPPTAQMPDEQEGEDPLPMALTFDEYVARKALELRVRGVKCGHRGRVEMRVSFAPTGTSTRAEVTSPGVAPKATQCMLNHLEKTSIPAFRGAEERAVQVSLAMR